MRAHLFTLARTGMIVAGLFVFSTPFALAFFAGNGINPQAYSERMNAYGEHFKGSMGVTFAGGVGAVGATSGVAGGNFSTSTRPTLQRSGRLTRAGRKGLNAVSRGAREDYERVRQAIASGSCTDPSCQQAAENFRSLAEEADRMAQGDPSDSLNESGGTAGKMAEGAKKILPFAALAGLGALLASGLGGDDDEEQEEPPPPAPPEAPAPGPEPPASPPVTPTNPDDDARQACFDTSQYPRPQDQTECLCQLPQYERTPECQPVAEFDPLNARTAQSQGEVDGIASLQQDSTGALTQVTNPAPTDGPEFRSPQGQDAPSDIGTPNFNAGSNTSSNTSSNGGGTSGGGSAGGGSTNGSSNGGSSNGSSTGSGDNSQLPSSGDVQFGEPGDDLGGGGGSASTGRIPATPLASRGLAESDASQEDTLRGGQGPCLEDPDSQACQRYIEARRQALLEENSALLSQ